MFENISAIAGLGLFLSGLTLLSAAMKSLVGKKLRMILERLSGNYAKRALAGSILGVATQSTSASTFICMGLVNSGSLKFNSTLTILAWSSVGGSLLVFMAAVDIRLMGLFLVAIVGISQLLSLDRHEKFKSFVSICLALGLLLLGLGMIKQGAYLIQGSYWVVEFVEFAAETGLICFIIGLFFTLITQSSSTITIIAITAVSAGIIPFNAAVILVFGSNLGSGLSLLMITSHLSGIQKQISFYQFLTKLSGVVLVMPLFLILSSYFMPQASADIDQASVTHQISIIYLALQIVGAISTSLFQAQISEFLEKIFPESHEEALSKTKYIYPEALNDPDIAIKLAKKEQDRLILSLTAYLDPLRNNQQGGISVEILNNANMHLLSQIKEFIDEISHQELGDEISSVIRLQSRNEALSAILVSLNTFATSLSNASNFSEGLIGAMIESLHLVLSLMEETVETNDNYEFLVELTSDRSQIMDRIREDLISDSTQNKLDRKSLFVSSRVFERVLWQIRQMINADYQAI